VASACSNTSHGSSEADAATSRDSGGPGTSVSGTAKLTFTPTFVGSAVSSGSCPVCGGLPMAGDAGGGGSFPSGPASYDGVVVVLSDDPNLHASCDADAGSGYAFDFQHYHYLTVQVLSTEPIAVGSYAIHSALSQADGGVSFGYVDDSVPLAADASHGIGYDNEDNGTGTVTITGLGNVVTGSFNAGGLELYGSGASQGNVSGSFDAPSCPSLAESAFQRPCGGCPG
jgi:hypothetical protein